MLEIEEENLVSKLLVSKPFVSNNIAYGSYVFVLIHSTYSLILYK